MSECIIVAHHSYCAPWGAKLSDRDEVSYLVDSAKVATDAVDKQYIFRVHELTIFGLGSHECVCVCVRACACIATLIPYAGLVWMLAEFIHVRYTCYRISQLSLQQTANIVRCRASLRTGCVCLIHMQLRCFVASAPGQINGKRHINYPEQPTFPYNVSRERGKVTR